MSPCKEPFRSRYLIERITNAVPHYLPEKNPFVDEMTQKYDVPREAAVGMPDTLYPEYRKKMKPAAV